MNILYILTFYGLSRPKGGSQNRYSNLTYQMKERNNITIMETNEHFHPDDAKYGAIFGYNDVKVSSRSMPISRDFNLNFIQNLADILKDGEIDAVILSHPSGALITKFMMKILGKNVPIIYDAHNVESSFSKEIISDNKSFSKLAQLIIPLYVSILERLSCKYVFDRVLAVSKNDEYAFIEKYNLDGNVSIVPSGCSVKPLLSPDERCRLREEYGIGPDSKVVVFHGSYSHPPNEEAFKLIKDVIAPRFEEEDVVFLVGGSGTPILENSNFKSIGFIDDLWNFLSIADMAVAPILKGGGTKLKLMDYLSAGLPVVTTSKGIEGIDAKNRVHVVITDSVDGEFIEKIRYLTGNQDERIRIGRNARKLAEETYDWNIIGSELDNILFEETHSGNKKSL